MRPICEAVGVPAWPLTRKSCDLSESPMCLTDGPPTASQFGLTGRPHRWASQMGLTDLRVRHPVRPVNTDLHGLTDRTL